MSLHALLAWTAVVLALSALALPLAAALFRGFPDRGASLAPSLAIGTLTLTGYWVGHLTFGPFAAVAGVLVLAAASVVAWRRGFRPDQSALRAPFLAFAIAYLGMLAVRYVDPGAIPAGGEKFLDYGLLATLLRTDILPPEDVWFAGEPVRYYYGGPLGVSLLAMLGDVPARYAYNLGLATYYAMLASAVYGLAAAIADAHGDRSSRSAGLAAAFLVCVAGRLVTPVRVLAGQLPRDFALRNLEWVVAGIRATPADAYAAVGDPIEWSYWLGRYVVPDALHVFPSWAFLNGDLHAHILATPYLVLAAAMAFAATRGTGRIRALLLVGALPATAGLLALTSTWSLPTAVGLAGLAVALPADHPLPHPRLVATRVRAELSRHALAGLVTGAVGLLAVAWAHPFLLYQRPVDRGIGLLPPGARLGPLLLAHGIFATLLFWGLARYRPSWGAFSRRGWFAAGIGVTLTTTTVLALELDALLLFVPLIVLGWHAARRGHGFDATLAVAGAGILLVVEFVYAQVWPFDPNAPRWNTIFKVSMQAFVLWGTAAGVVLARTASDLRHRHSAGAFSRRHIAATALVVVLVAAAATFPAMALAEHFGGVADDTEHTLDATAYVENWHPEEAAALRFLRENVEGTPTLVTAPGEPMYTWVSAPASLTGIPTVVGWRHEAGYRGLEAYTTRKRHVGSIYEADWPAAALLLDVYDVDYVYVGPVERDRYAIRGFAGHDGVSVAYRNAAVMIYEIDASRACAATNLTCPTS